MSDNTRSLTISFLTMRKIIGILGILLGFIVVLGGLLSSSFENSISRYYHTNMRDIIVGTLVATAVFLFAYKGYERIDNIVTNLLGIFALGIALFPCQPALTPEIGARFSFLVLPISFSNTIHMISATAFFALLIFNDLVLFTKTSGEMTAQKIKRNRVYKTCALFIALGYLVAASQIIFPILATGPTILIAEVIMLVAFGVAWLVKGEGILQDLTV